MAQTETLSVTSHVGRDLLASAGSFKTEAAATWEYVVNSLQYVDDGVSPRVEVVVRPRSRTIEVNDNGRGMTAADLRHYFTMHAENVERLKGRAGRGKFGTGKSAAFGIGNRLTVDTRRNGLRNVVELRFDMIKESGGEEIPLNWQVRNESTQLANGTRVTISEISLKRISATPIIEYIERHLQAFRAFEPEVVVNNHLCSYREPQVSKSFTFYPSDEQAAEVGRIQLTVKVSNAPLPEYDQGVFITAGPGNLVAREGAGIERKEFGNYLFGEVDVPRLEQQGDVIQPYDATRSLKLNPNHQTAAVLIGFIGSKLESVRLGLVREAREARKTEQARRLAKEAERIADVLNADFREIRRRLRDVRVASSPLGAAGAAFGDSAGAGEDDDVWIKGTEELGTVERTDRATSQVESESKEKPPRQPPSISAAGNRDDDGSDPVDRAGGTGSRRTKPRGGFQVEYRNLGADQERSIYDRATLKILINLDHPVLATALEAGGSVEEVGFRRLSYEVAFSEYAIALAYEMAEQDPGIPADDLLFEVRSSVNRVSTAAARLYR
jgi:hypothetical protein